jgi:hypothetical protein
MMEDILKEVVASVPAEIQKRGPHIAFLSLDPAADLTPELRTELAKIFKRWGPRFLHPDCVKEVEALTGSSHEKGAEKPSQHTLTCASVLFLFKQWVLRERSVGQILVEQTSSWKTFSELGIYPPLEATFSVENHDFWTETLLAEVRHCLLSQGKTVDNLEAQLQSLHSDLFGPQETKVLFGFPSDEGSETEKKAETDERDETDTKDSLLDDESRPSVPKLTTFKPDR